MAKVNTRRDGATYHRGVWVPKGYDPTAPGSDFHGAMAEYHKYFPNVEKPNDPRSVSSSYRIPGL